MLNETLVVNNSKICESSGLMSQHQAWHGGGKELILEIEKKTIKLISKPIIVQIEAQRNSRRRNCKAGIGDFAGWARSHCKRRRC